MRNQPHSLWQLIDSSADRREEAWNLDRQVELRTWLTGLVLIFALCVISVRLYALMQQHQAKFLANAHPLSVRSELVPAMDGRIYSSDGQLLAYDHQRFTVAVHYRWLQSPPDERWLRQQARQRLNRKEWSDPEAVEAAQQAVLEIQAAMWQRLAEISGVSPTELTQRRERIQQRIEKISAAVNRRREERERQSLAAEAESETIDQDGTWQQWWRFVVRELTEPPRRENRDPIIVQEELDYHELIEEIPTAIVAEMEAHPQEFPGVRVLLKTQRRYPLGNFAAHVIGNRTAIRQDQLDARRENLSAGDPLSYRSGDRQGRFGVERSYDVTLRGLPGAQQLTRDRRGEVVRTDPERQSRSGQHLVLTLHSQLQRTAEQLLDARIAERQTLVPPLPAGMPIPADSPPTAGCILVMNIYSGELVAAASAPRPDLSRLTSGEAGYWQELTGDPRSPLLSRITQVGQAPGSTFKLVTAAAVCETLGTPGEEFVCQGFLETPQAHRCAIFQSAGIGHGPISLTGAIARSCNVYFFEASRKLGPEALGTWCRAFRFGEPTGVDLPFEQRGHVPGPADNGPHSRYQWYPGDNLGLAIGQSYLTVTPLQLLVMTAAIANGGELIRPVVVNRVVPDETQPQVSERATEFQDRVLGRLDVRDRTLAELRRGMEQVVADRTGTAFATVRSSKVKIAGKTGTAQTGLNRPNHAWFVGYAPAESPQYAFVVLLEQGGAGGAQAGPLAREIVEKMLELELLYSSQGSR